MILRALSLSALLFAPLSAAVADTEEPAYTVLETAADYEIRAYETLTVASVEVRGTHSQGLNRGFRTLAGFIFGGNSRSESIAMTAPVMQRETTEGEVAEADRRFVITFVMPSKFTLETLPQPEAEEVKLHTMGPQRIAVIRFAGRGSEENFAEHHAKLEAALKRDGVVLAGDPIYAQYDEPWKPASSRRNEILWPVSAPAPSASK